MLELTYLCVCGDHESEHMPEEIGHPRACINLECECLDFQSADAYFSLQGEIHGEACTGCPQSTAEVESTVKRASLWDGVIDTHQTETELNGFKAKQGALL